MAVNISLSENTTLDSYPGRSVTTICNDNAIREFGKIRISVQLLGRLKSNQELSKPKKKLLSPMLYGAGASLGWGAMLYMELPTNETGFGILLGDPEDFDTTSIEEEYFEYGMTDIGIFPHIGCTIYANQFNVVVQHFDGRTTKYSREDASISLVPDILAVKLLPTSLQKQIVIQEV